jgi:hypothetical protein
VFLVKRITVAGYFDEVMKHPVIVLLVETIFFKGGQTGVKPSIPVRLDRKETARFCLKDGRKRIASNAAS